MPGTDDATPFAYKPLYVQVKDRLIRRLIDGAWQPGQLIPSEIDLAREVGVSQGTIRKALDAMAGDNLLVRRQGRGTYVAVAEESRVLFQFFRLVPDSGEASFPESRIIGLARRSPDGVEQDNLKLGPQAEVWRIARMRTLQGIPAIVEDICLPCSRFPGLDGLAAIPNNVYRLYSDKWGITVGRARERLKAIGASPGDAAALGCASGTPLIEISRVASDLEGHPIEFRISRCLTAHLHYLSDPR